MRPPSARPATTTTWPPSLTGRPARCAAPAPSSPACWERDYVSTFNALNDATQPWWSGARGRAGDFPAYFSSRCIHFPEFFWRPSTGSSPPCSTGGSTTAASRRAAGRCAASTPSSPACWARRPPSWARSWSPTRCGRSACGSASPPRGRLRQGSAFRDEAGHFCAWSWKAPPAPALRRAGGSAELSTLLGVPLRLEEQGSRVRLSWSSRSPSWRWRGWPPGRRTGRR